ncbi:MAG: hypothetical protein ACI82F_003798 [Planctomycetota bacterium]|jgi:hypothetical protein
MLNVLWACGTTPGSRSADVHGTLGGRSPAAAVDVPAPELEAAGGALRDDTSGISWINRFLGDLPSTGRAPGS